MNLQGKEVLVTGGAGFIGSHLVERLVNEKANISVIKKQTTSIINLENCKDDIKLHNCDLTDFENLNKIVKEIKPSIIFNLASYSTVNPSDDVNFVLNNNFQTTVNLFKSLNGNFDIFLHTGSVAEYGNGQVPFKEGQLPIANSQYSLAKICSTYYCQMLYEMNKLPITILRPFLTYGPRQSSFNMLIPRTILYSLENKEIQMTKGEQTRDCIYVDDVVEGFIKAAKYKEAIGQIINLGTGKEHTIKEIVLKIVELTGSIVRPEFNLEYRPAESMHSYCSNEKAKKLLNWEPEYTLEQGLEKTVGWYKEKFESGELEKWKK